MGKRKLHAQTYFQCDWTGLPMRQTNCYMPDWNENGKLLKHGSYCCWEAVLAHAAEFPHLTSGAILSESVDKLKRIQEHINDLVGCTVLPAPHWSKLAWFARSTDEEFPSIRSPQEFFDIVTKVESPIVAVRIPTDGIAHEVLCTATDVSDKFAAHLTKPFNLTSLSPWTFNTVRKKANKDRDLTVFYWPGKNGLNFNQTASNAFKMQIYGDALVLQQTKEPCFLPRERYINYYQSNFHDQFSNKNKRKDPQVCFTSEEYSVAKAQMASELQSVEDAASALASLPGELAKAAVLPPPSGKELAALLVARGQKPPKKRLRPTPISPSVAAAAPEQQA